MAEYGCMQANRVLAQGVKAGGKYGTLVGSRWHYRYV